MHQFPHVEYSTAKVYNFSEYIGEKMNILIVSQHYYPEQFRINDISFELAKRGHKVTVLTGLPNYPEGKIYDGYQNKQNRNQTVNGVHIIRTSLIGRGKSLLTFGLNYAWFAIAGKQKAKTLHEDFDVIFSYQTSPVSMVWPAIEVKKRQNIPLVLYCLDQWPISITTGPFSKGTPAYSFFWKLSVDTYNKADRILITSKSFENYFNKELKLSTEKYGLDYWPQYAEDIYQNTVQNINGTYDVLYAGNIGPAADVEVIVKAAEYLKEHKNIHFHIVGDGVNRQNCEQMAINAGLDNITFYGSHKVDEMKQYYDLADAFLITMKDNEVVNYTLPAKMQSYMLAGKTIIGAINGETKRVIQDADCGYCGPSGDAHRLAENILKASEDEQDTYGRGKNARMYYHSHFDKEKLLDELEKIFQEEIDRKKIGK